MATFQVETMRIRLALAVKTGSAILAMMTLLAGCSGEEGNPVGQEKTSTQAGKPAALPEFATLNLYSPTSPFNQKIAANAEIDPNSQMLVQSLLDAGDMVIQIGQYSSTVFFATDTTPRHDVKLECGPAWELGVTVMKDVPIPEWAEPAHDRDGAAPPVGCGEDADQDNHMVILDLTRRCEYDFWQARNVDGQWIASWGNSIKMDSDGVYPKGMSTRGSGFAFLGGVIWPDELKKGEIRHALAFSYPFPKAGGPVSPATSSDGTSDRADAIPEGARLQLNPELNLDELNLAPYEKVIARALQEYGMFLVDHGGESGIGLYAIDPASVSGNPYEGLLPEGDYVPLPNIPVQEFRVLKMAPQDSNWQQRLGLVASGCAEFQ
ncbi:MAG: hypothetical protein Q9P14_04660 [candidate division KSB1 bacterium]|nr:hypothetical protein [candidate division KSB1 bacterium]MDQ7065545.1 hypothetical protein [candidate division KSB1 bacterium]